MFALVLTSSHLKTEQGLEENKNQQSFMSNILMVYIIIFLQYFTLWAVKE